MSTIRAPAVAGSFYPDERAALEEMTADLLAARRSGAPAPKAVIVPHAGYIYSGPIAASAYARVANGRDYITRVVLLGPSHQVPFRGLAAGAAQYYATPLGTVPVDGAALDRIRHLRQVRTLDRTHQWEHSLEVQLPFLQTVLDDFSLVPLVVGTAEAEEVGAALELLWGDSETLIVISSDLSHYRDYAAAQELDRATSEAITKFRLDDIDYERACGRNPIRGLLAAARRRGLRAETVDLRNSGDTAGAHDRVVGYGAYIFH